MHLGGALHAAMESWELAGRWRVGVRGNPEALPSDPCVLCIS